MVWYCEEDWYKRSREIVHHVVSSTENSLIEEAELQRVREDIEQSKFSEFFNSKKLNSLDNHQTAIRYLEFVIVRSFMERLIKIYELDDQDMCGFEIEKLKKNYRKADNKLRNLNAKYTLHVGLQNDIPEGNNVGPRRTWSNKALIKNECKKKKAHIPIRELISRSRDALLAMKPVWLMQPLTISQMLPKTIGLFDIVVIDEASQMLPETAFGAILRGKQTVIVGDDKQMPPSSFFKISNENEEDGEDEIVSESILDLAAERFNEVVSLRWHYRSRHESLINFSNHHFYDNILEVVPSPHTSSSKLGVEKVFVKSEYKSGINIPEVKALIVKLREHMSSHPELSCGVVAMNEKQRVLIEEELLRESDNDPIFRSYYEKWNSTELDYPMVKSLERVQGDERDVIFISTVYGPDRDGKMYQRFPLINTDYGHRRLNVLFTRARCKVVLVTSLQPQMIKIDESSKRGKLALRDYVEYASNGRLETGRITGEAADSDFELAVGQTLEQAGYSVTPQVGVKGFKIDLGVKHPEYPSGFLAGIECDGATFHSSPQARDRDAIRQDILEALGWHIYRIWSTDWFNNYDRERKKMLDYLERLRSENK